MRSLSVSILPYSACWPLGTLFQGGIPEQPASPTAKTTAANATKGFVISVLRSPEMETTLCPENVTPSYS